ncbi:hypothetical protein HD597_003739 [Nonomuraea thailandensis]|uniref:DDE Tnp4 domain-containing protein n=1 Tax=Nonomuraea thailandensis TaxID=1188745 RepID=A0A9X2GFU5_9ACTN|nr:hypothetical protein [Nonomuraea thailandensis]
MSSAAASERAWPIRGKPAPAPPGATSTLPSYARATILDGTPVPIDRLANERPYYSGEHRRRGVNVYVVADPAGRFVWASPVLPGVTHDLAEARAFMSAEGNAKSAPAPLRCRLTQQHG